MNESTEELPQEEEQEETEGQDQYEYQFQQPALDYPVYPQPQFVEAESEVMEEERYILEEIVNEDVDDVFNEVAEGYKDELKNELAQFYGENEYEIDTAFQQRHL